MTAALAILLLGFQAPEEPSIKFSGSSFAIQVDGKKIDVPMKEPVPKPPESVAFRKGDKYAVWDNKRGLSVRSGNWARTTKLPEAAVSPRLFSREEIVNTLALIKSGKRRKEASALSGGRRVGDFVYLLVRWDDKAGVPWLEALYKVDFKLAQPVPQLIGRFDGTSLSKAKIDDKLLILDGLLGIVAKMGDGWGYCKFDPEQGVFSAFRFGTMLQGYFPLTSRVGLFWEGTNYGSTMCGRVDLGSGNRRLLFEARGWLKPLDGNVVLIRRKGGARLRNIKTGGERSIPALSDARMTPLGLLVWSPAHKPVFAELLDPGEWKIVARMAPPAPGS